MYRGYKDDEKTKTKKVWFVGGGKCVKEKQKNKQVDRQKFIVDIDIVVGWMGGGARGN